MYNLLPVLTAARERRAAAAADEAVDRPIASGACRSRLSVVGLGDRAQPLSAPAVGRPGTARRHRPRDRHRPDAAAVRRADRRSRSQGRRRDPRAAADAQPRARQDHRHGDARSARGRAREAHAAPRKGHCWSRRSPHEVPPARPRAICCGARSARSSRSCRSSIAFLLFGVLMAIRAAFSMGVDIAGADRLMVIHKVSIIQPLPRELRPEDSRRRPA